MDIGAQLCALGWKPTRYTEQFQNFHSKLRALVSCSKVSITYWFWTPKEFYQHSHYAFKKEQQRINALFVIKNVNLRQQIQLKKHSQIFHLSFKNSVNHGIWFLKIANFYHFIDEAQETTHFFRNSLSEILHMHWRLRLQWPAYQSMGVYYTQHFRRRSGIWYEWHQMIVRLTRAI